MTDPTVPNPTPDESPEVLRRRIAELEEALGKMTRQREETRRMFFALLDQEYPELTMTEEDVRQALASGEGPSLSEIIAEFERGRGAA